MTSATRSPYSRPPADNLTLSEVRGRIAHEILQVHNLRRWHAERGNTVGTDYCDFVIVTLLELGRDVFPARKRWPL